MFELLLLGNVFPSSSSSSTGITSHDATANNKSSGTETAEPLVSSCSKATSEPDRMAKVFITRLGLIAQQYHSTYLFVHEITLYELMCVLIRQCLQTDCLAVTIDKKKIAKLFDNYEKGAKLPPSVKQASKIVTLRSVLEYIRAIDVTGQLLQCMGLLHLWSQYRSKPLFTHITPLDITIFHHFIAGHYGHVLQSIILQPQDIDKRDKADGVVCLVKEREITTDTMDKTVDQVDRAIVKFIFNWTRAKREGLNQRLSLLQSEPKIKAKNCESTEQSAFVQEQEALGRIFLNDYMYRRFMKKCEDSMRQTDTLLAGSSHSRVRRRSSSGCLETIDSAMAATVEAKAPKKFKESQESSSKSSSVAASSSLASSSKSSKSTSAIAEQYRGKPRVISKREVDRTKARIEKERMMKQKQNLKRSPLPQKVESKQSQANNPPRDALSNAQMSLEQKNQQLQQIRSETDKIRSFLSQSPEESESKVASLHLSYLSTIDCFSSEDDDAPNGEAIKLIEKLIVDKSAKQNEKFPTATKNATSKDPKGKSSPKTQLPLPPPSRLPNKTTPMAKPPLPKVVNRGGTPQKPKPALDAQPKESLKETIPSSATECSPSSTNLETNAKTPGKGSSKSKPKSGQASKKNDKQTKDK